jgi:MinD-like ATPase involved in chromosome partitioning or flagellar assembly
MDLDDDYGALLDLVPERMRTTRSFESLEAHDGPVPFPRLRACLSVTRSRMLVLRGPEETADLDDVLAKLANADVVILDCAAGVDRPRARWALGRADQVIVVARPEATGSRAAALATERALRNLQVTGSLVINRKRVRTDTSVVQTAFSLIACLENTVHLPESRRFARGLERTEYQLERLGPRTRLAVKELAAIVGRGLR